jgi:hypothetical protein
MTYIPLFRRIAGAISLLCAVAARAQSPAPIDVAKLYPHTKDEIRIALNEIERRRYQPPPFDPAQPASVNLDARSADAQQKGLNELNIYRFLCGLPHNVAIDGKLIAQAQQAAEACKTAGHLSHDLGSFTEACNLHSDSHKIDNASQVRGYIEDNGSNNRERRGHRMWCLSPELGKTGFGIAGGFAAMNVKDTSGSTYSESWAYPGKGWFPRSRLHGDAWSLYLKKDAPVASEVKVRMWKLLRAPKDALQNADFPVGREIKIKAIFTNRHCINFEPDIVAGKDTYWISVEGTGVSEKYLVDLY